MLRQRSPGTTMPAMPDSSLQNHRTAGQYRSAAGSSAARSWSSENPAELNLPDEGMTTGAGSSHARVFHEVPHAGHGFRAAPGHRQ